MLTSRFSTLRNKVIFPSYRSLSSMPSYGKSLGFTMDDKSQSQVQDIRSSFTLQDKKYGVKQHLKRIANKTAVSLTTVGGVAAAGTTLLLYIDPTTGLVLYGGSMITTFVSIYMVDKYQPEVKETVVNNQKEISVIDPPSRVIWHTIFNSTLGITLIPILGIYPDAIMPALIATGGVTAGSLAAAYIAQPGSMLPYQSAMYSGLLGLLGMSIIDLIFHVPVLHDINTYGGVLLFSGYNALDLHIAEKEYQEGKMDVIPHSMNFTLNFVNIFIRFMEIFGKIQQNRK